MKKQQSFFTAFIILALLGISLVYAANSGNFSQRIQGTVGNPHILGTFDPRGNAGVVDLATDPSPSSFTGVHMIASYDIDAGTSENYLTGYFHLQTVGWATFSDVGQGKVVIVPPTGGTANVRDPWTLSGFAWSETAGWIRLNPDSVNWTSGISGGVQYLPDTRMLTGFAWSETLGWIPFTSIAPIQDIAEGFIGKVKILGNISANSTFDVLYSVGEKIGGGTSLNGLINLVRKNLAILYRNAGNFINTTIPTAIVPSPLVLNKTIYYSLPNNTDENQVVRYSYLKNALSSQQSLVVQGANIYIDEDILQDANEPRVLVALRNNLGHGGNIIIAPTIKNIKISLVTEGSLLTGIMKADNTIYLYNDTKQKLAFGLPKAQLYIKGNVQTYNTIGGSAKDGIQKCPIVETNCDRNTAIKYDLNYFRVFDKKTENRSLTGYDDYSIIIEQDARVITRPPLILANN